MSPRQRTLALLGLAAALWALRAWMDTGDLADAPAPRAGRPAAARPAMAASAAAPAWALAERPPMDDAGQDPFGAALPAEAPAPAARRALAPAMVASAPALPAPTLPAAASAPPPRLPYRFVGLMTENGKPARVYLALGDQLIEARPGDLLDGGYQLQSIAPRELVFLNTQLKLTVRMPVDGETS